MRSELSIYFRLTSHEPAEGPTSVGLFAVGNATEMARQKFLTFLLHSHFRLRNTIEASLHNALHMRCTVGYLDGDP